MRRKFDLQRRAMEGAGCNGSFLHVEIGAGVSIIRGPGPRGPSGWRRQRPPVGVIRAVPLSNYRVGRRL